MLVAPTKFITGIIAGLLLLLLSSCKTQDPIRVGFVAGLTGANAALKEVKTLNPDCIFVIASAFDTALIAQQARLEDIHTQLLATNWALTEDLIENGGTTVDGIKTVVAHDENNTTAEYIEFEKKFKERYTRKPTFAAGYGYEAMLVLADALQKTNGEKNGLAEALLQTKDFTGVNGKISFDKNGDILRTLYLIEVREGKFVTTAGFPAAP
jgi:branched-chain amino acid transport system substrate-binding protein